MKVSVVVPTYNRGNGLNLVMHCLINQTYPAAEILVVVDGSTDNTIEVLTGLQKDISNLKIIYQENKGRATVRNTGAENAQGELLIFCDDDMRPTTDWIEEHVRHHEKHPNSILTGAQIEEVKQDTSEFVKFKAYLSIGWSKPLIDIGETPLSRQQIFITAANFSIPKQVFNDLGGFDSRLRDTEDYDLAVRAFKYGVDLYFNYRAFAWHDDIITCRSYIRRLRQYEKARIILIQLKPWLHEEGFIKDKLKISGWKRAFYTLFTRGFWVKAADKGFLKVLPKKARYRVYDFIITANGVYFPNKALI